MYKITFFENKHPELLYTSEAIASDYKKGLPMERSIFITPSGRNIRSKPFNKNVIYKIRVCSLEKKKRRSPLQVVIVHGEGGFSTEIALMNSHRTYYGKEFLEDIYTAIICADKEYSKVGGGVLYRNPLYKDETLLQKMRSLLEENLK